MTFSSLQFIFRFLPIFIIIYYLVPKKIRNLTLLCGSLLFYALGEVIYLPILVIAVIVNYAIGLWMTKRKEKGKKIKFLFYLGIILDIGMLATCKSGKVTSTLPLGISFYTFTMLSYLIDVYRGTVKADSNMIRVSTYFCMFPQLISGPIVRYGELSDQLLEPSSSFSKFENGLRIFTIGLGYKVILADQLATLWNSIQIIGFESISTPLAWLGVIGYSLQLYFDFSGYSLMAMGVAGMIGFSLPINFAHPYMSKSVSEFWRRWHITLGKWFRDYVYIPLGGNRVGAIRQYFNLLVVWLLTGIWHGMGLNFLLWGGSLFLLIAMEKIFLQQALKKCKILSRIYLLFFIGLTWMLFAINDLGDIRVYFCRLFPFVTKEKEIAVNAFDFIKQGKEYAWLIVSGIFLSTPIAMKWYMKHKSRLFCVLILTLVFWVSVYLLTLGSNNPFMYFRF